MIGAQNDFNVAIHIGTKLSDIDREVDCLLSLLLLQ